MGVERETQRCEQVSVDIALMLNSIDASLTKRSNRASAGIAASAAASASPVGVGKKTWWLVIIRSSEMRKPVAKTSLTDVLVHESDATD